MCVRANKPIMQQIKISNLQPLFLVFVARSLSLPPLPPLPHPPSHIQCKHYEVKMDVETSDSLALCAPPRKIQAITFQLMVNMVPRY